MNSSSENKIILNLKGIIVGNGVTNWKWDGDQAYVEIGKYHGLYGLDLAEQMTKNNCDYYYEDIQPKDSDACKSLYA